MNLRRISFVLIGASIIVFGGLYIYLFLTSSLKFEFIQGTTGIQIRKRSPYANMNTLLDKIMPSTVSLISCKKLFDGDPVEMNTTYKLMENLAHNDIKDMEYINLTQNCSSFRMMRRYITNPLDDVEESFPLAFSIVMYKDVYQAERLLRAIYRPQNIYCIHVDQKAVRGVKEAMKCIASCFENVFIASKLHSVRWGTLSVLDADLSCMAELLQNHKSWKYFINLTGQEFPLRTNYELVKILSVYDGANDIFGSTDRRWHTRWKYAGKPPYNIRPLKGSVHIVANRDFVDFLINNRIAQEFYKWTKKTKIPDETFFPTLNHNPQFGVKGQYNGSRPPHKIRHFSRYKIWTQRIGTGCHGKIVHGICILGIGDLPFLRTSYDFFVNKFHWNYQSFALDCMEELYFNTTINEYEGIENFTTSVYENADIVKYAVK
ncbi:hypothetical protein ACJMK2_038522 [Sinanodonta woodiana]|uniref:Beta-1,3-galactosyl-O-glycosyl-glycoprotein beta-1,6-N-acetylglucosaminyltransferase n=1 Tax=Sinanodonta woodiana TaxID=1069815 RepID=A0ABD3W994_SINWO